MSAFSKRFKLFIEQDIEPTPEEQAMQSTLDGAEPDQLGASGVDQAVLQAAAQQEQQMVQHIKNWIGELDKFTNFLNDPDDQSSIQSILRNSVPDTILDKIRTTETKKIARTAMDLASLAQSMKGYLSGSSDPKYRFR
jgi:hypothetical protein